MGKRTSEITDFDTLKCNHRVIFSLERFGLLAPESHSNAATRLVYDSDVTFGDSLLCRLNIDGINRFDFRDHSQYICSTN